MPADAADVLDLRFEMVEAVANDDPLIGATLGGLYRVERLIGVGGMGRVYRATHTLLGKDYAIKFLKVDDEAVRDAVIRELESVRYFAQVDHPNLVSIEDKGEVDGIPYILMSYAGQGTLRQFILNSNLLN